jgi:hypothetical protein
MSTEQQRIAIAKVCGWTDISDWKAGGINGKHPTEPWTEVIPDYLNDLNAMHEAEKMLSKDQTYHYCDWLCNELCSYETVTPAVQATAAQRAEAFLSTIGKWTTNPNEP